MTVTLAHQSSPAWNLRVSLICAGLWIGWIGVDRIRGTGFERIPRSVAPGIAGVGAVFLVCGIVLPGLMTAPAPSSVARPSSRAEVVVFEPTPGEVIDTPTFPVRVRVVGARVVSETSRRLAPDTGHVHVSLDGRLLSMTYARDESFDASGLEPGPHVLTVEFVAVDHAPFDPPVIERVSFVKGSDP